MELKDTVDLMLSDDWKDRLKAEYWQTKIRYNKLKEAILRREARALDSESDLKLGMLKEQMRFMELYLVELMTFCIYEDVILDLDGEHNG